jgi:RNA polymerase sigma-70 factor (ECF subfamily)
MARQADPFDPHVLVLKAKHGDGHAFELLVQHYQPQVKKLVSRYIVDQNEVLDLTQETFIKAFRALKNFRGDSQFFTWLYRIAINTVKNYASYNSHHTPTDDLSLNDNESNHYWLKQFLQDTTTPESALLGEELEVLLLKVLRGMAPELRLSLLLRDIEGLSYREIAETMHCPIGTVRSRIFRARATVMGMLHI